MNSRMLLWPLLLVVAQALRVHNATGASSAAHQGKRLALPTVSTRPLEFIHIPRTGGTAVENAAKKFMLWGVQKPQLKGQMVVGPKGQKCHGQHVPPSLVPDLYEGKETFCIFRDPFDRMISQFGFQVSMFPNGKFKCNARDLNAFLTERLEPKKPKEMQSGYPFGSDCHFLPQAAYIFAWDKNRKAVDRSKRWCTHVFHFEEFGEELNAFWAERGFGARMSPKKRSGTSSNGACLTLKASDLSEDVKSLIKRVQHDDFDIMESGIIKEHLKTE